jgi:DNA polymerase III subunit alpha
MSDSSNPADLHHNLEASLKTPKRFAHLHQHTQYSLLDGAARIKDLLKWVAKTSPTNPTVAMTDHGNMHGAVQFFKYANEYGVKPIIGYEAYVSAGSRFDRKMEKGVEGGYYHLTLLAKNFEGYQNLCKLSSIAYLEGYYYKPRIDREVLALHHKGVIAMSGCLGAEVPNLILQDRLEEAEERLKWYQALFKEDYYIEIQNHGLPEQQKVNPVLKAWAIKHGIGMVATNDGHYVKHEDAYAHEVLLAIQTKALMSEEKRFKFSCDDFYVKTQLEMEEKLPSLEWGDEIYDNSINIADKCNLELPIGNKRVYQMPALPIPEGRSMAEELRVQVYEGSLKRYPKDLTENLYRRYVQVSLEQLDTERKAALLKRIPNLEPETANLETLILAMAFMGTVWVEQFKDEKYTQYPGLDWLEEHEPDAWGQGLIVLRRAEYESGVIIRMGFPDYFLIVADFINWAKDQNIRVGPGRGSGAGSLVAYALRITNLDPLFYGLLFERFLNPDRVSMPDFDVDFSDTRRNEVIEYVRDKYGDDKVAMIATFGTMASRAVFKDVARVLELPFAEADKLSKLVPVKFGKSLSLEDAAKTVPDIAAMLEENEKTKEVFGIAQSLEGLTRHASVHASGVIIGRERLDNLVPLMRDSSGEGVVCQLDMSSVEDIGLIKMDFLGLRTLSFLEEAMRIVKESKGVSLEPDDFPLDDSKTYDLISRGETKGVFQLEGGGITEAAKRLKPRRIQDVNALSALYRPGPMDNIPAYIERHHGREQVRYDQGEFDLPTCEPLLKPILEETYGIPVYQEQIMQIASAVAGYSLGQSDLLRRAMGKKKLEEMNKERIKFEEGALKVNKIPKTESNRLFDILEKFANYGFNKSHSAAYAFISFQTAYIKAHYPVEFMAALLTVERKDSDKVAEYINDARHIKLDSGNRIEIDRDIHICSTEFKVEGEKILFGLLAIKSLGENTAKDIIKSRDTGTRFASFVDICSRLCESGISKKTVELLINAGFCDKIEKFLIGKPESLIREILLVSLDSIWSHVVKESENKDTGSLFNMNPELAKLEYPSDENEARTLEIQCLRREKEALGLYISGHPIDQYPGMREAASTKAPHLEHWFHNSGAIAGYRGRKKAVLSGEITGIQRKPTKSGGMMARVNLTDDVGSLELVAFSRAYEKINTKLVEGMLALVVIEVEPDGEGIRVSIEDVLTFDEARAMPKILSLELDLEEVGETQLEKLDEILQNQEGVPNTPIRVWVRSDAGYEVWELEVKATPSTPETLKLECPWLQPKLGINGDAVLAKYERAAKPWEKKAQGGEARVLN